MQTDLLMTATVGERDKSITRAVELLRKGEIVALPTETVYGLAADTLNPIAVAKIFEAKGRPRFDPLIIHLPDQDWLEKTDKVRHQPSRHKQHRSPVVAEVLLLAVPRMTS